MRIEIYIYIYAYQDKTCSMQVYMVYKLFPEKFAGNIYNKKKEKNNVYFF